MKKSRYQLTYRYGAYTIIDTMTGKPLQDATGRSKSVMEGYLRTIRLAERNAAVENEA